MLQQKTKLFTMPCMRGLILFLFIIFFTNLGYALSYCDSNKGHPGFNCGVGSFYDVDLPVPGCRECDPEYYCLGNGVAFCCNTKTNGNFPKSEEGSDSIDDCYADIDCYDYDDSVERCERHYDNDINCSRIRGAHIENINGNDTCYAGSRRCRLFGSENCSESEISGTATRISGHSGNEWDISSCSCGVADFEDSTTLFCHGKQNGVRPSSSTVSNAGVAINYNGSRDGYYCTRCVLDNGNIKYYANTTDSNGTQCSPGGNHVCKCETSSELGYWREGKCNSGTDWTGNNICKRVSCPVGKTTNEILPTDILGCHYSRDTKFCDANGCFNITDADNSGNWNWYY